MAILTLLGCLALAADSKPPATAADMITLRDGQIIRGQVSEPVPRGKLILIVRRAWAEAHVPALAKRWLALDASTAERARRQRVERLEAWRRERVAEPGRDDPIKTWLDAEIGRLKDEQAPPPPLLLVSLSQGEVRSVHRQPKDAARLLRQGWISRQPDVEEKPVDDLKRLLEGRGFAMSDVDAADVSPLLPIPAETEAHWRERRAATEVLHDSGLRLVQFHGLVMPEETAGEGVDPKAALDAVKSLLGQQGGEDPLRARAREVAARGRIGLVVTKLDTSEDFERVTVEATLYVLVAPDVWRPAASRRAMARTAEVAKGEEAPIATDPQVKTTFGVFEGLGLGLGNDAKGLSVRVGAATRRALGMAQSALAKDLEARAIELAPSRRDEPQPVNRP